MLALTFLRVPIAFAMGTVGIGGIALMKGWAPAMAMATQVTYETGFSYLFSVVPLFILMGTFVTARRDGRGAVRDLLRLHRPPARRAGDGDHRRLRRLRRDLRLEPRHRGHHVAGGDAADAQVRLLERARHRLHRRRRHARHPDPAFDRAGAVRHHYQHQHRQAVRRRGAARTGRDVLLRHGGAVDHLARPQGRPAGRAPELEGALRHTARRRRLPRARRWCSPRSRGCA